MAVSDFCVDYRKVILHNTQRFISLSLPHIDETLEDLGSSEWFLIQVVDLPVKTCSIRCSNVAGALQRP